jgi:hypothetical protein
MNIRSVGPNLYLASQAATKDGQLDFVCARQADRRLLMNHLSARLAEKKHKFPLPIRRFRQLRIVWRGSALHFDDQFWPRKKGTLESPSEIEITVRPSALIILQPVTAIKS